MTIETNNYLRKRLLLTHELLNGLEEAFKKGIISEEEYNFKLFFIQFRIKTLSMTISLN